MKIKKGDMVVITTGKDKGKTGKVSHAFPRLDRVVVEGINIKKKHMRARKSGEHGQIIEIASPIHVSNVMLEDKAKARKATKTKAPTAKPASPKSTKEQKESLKKEK